MRLLFIDPPLITKENTPFIKRGELAPSGSSSYPNLAFGYLSAVAESKGHTCRVIDLNVVSLDLDRMVRDFAPDFIFLTSLTAQYRATKIVINQLKGKAPLVLGGSHASIFKEKLLDDGVDVVVVGEGEQTLVALLENYPDHLTAVPGIVFRKEEQRIQTPPSEMIRDLDSLPFPAWHLFDLNLYDNIYLGRKGLPIISSRGCPFHCVYCFKGVFGDKIRIRSAANIVAEIKFFKEKYDIGAIFFCDDLFTVNRKRVEDFCHLLLKDKLDIYWRCLGRADQVDYNLLALMKQAGCQSFAMGIESGNQNVLDKVGKKIKLERVAQTIRDCNKIGIISKGYYIIGLPWDTHESVRDTIRFARQNRTTQLQFTLPLAYPGTELWEIGKAKGLPVEKYVETFTWEQSLSPYSFSDDLDEKQIEYYVLAARRIGIGGRLIKMIRQSHVRDYPWLIKMIFNKLVSYIRVRAAMRFK